MIKNFTTFFLDYTSCPSSIGQIVTSDGRVILITEPGVGPQSLDEAMSYSRIPSDVINIAINRDEDYDLFIEEFNKILKTNHVDYVHDVELAGQYPEYLYDQDDYYFTLNNWIEARKPY